MPDRDDNDLIGLLTLFMASGKLDAAHVLPALSRLTRTEVESSSISDLLAALRSHEGSEFDELAGHVQSLRQRDAAQFHKLRRAGAESPDQFQLLLGDLPLDTPAGWRDEKQLFTAIKRLLSVARDRRYVSAKREIAATTAAHIDQQYDAAVARAVALSESWNSQLPIRLIQELYATDIDSQLATDLQSVADQIQQAADNQTQAAVEVSDDSLESALSALDGDLALVVLQERYQRTTTRNEQQRLLDRLCSWEDPAVTLVLKELIQETWEQERAALILTCRFGERPVAGWEGWNNWLTRCESQLERRQQQLTKFAQENPGEMFLVWYSQQDQPDETILLRLEQWCEQNAKRVDPERFVERWASAIPSAEWNALLGIEFEIVDQTEPVVAATDESPPLKDESAAPVVETVSPATPSGTVVPDVVPATRVDEPQGPSLWKDHIQPFFSEHWYMFAGVVMVIAGSSLLAYYTWDKHWLIRYTIMPVLLGLFTAALAWTGSWVERQGQEFVGTSAILRGAAIGLLPINFMAVALLSNDDSVTQKTLVVPFMGAIYLAAFGYGLKSWCRSLHPPLEWLLGGTLLLVNSLVMLGPLAETVAHVSGRDLLTVIGMGFHLGFLVLALVVIRFTRNVLTRELAEQKRVPWFFGATLIVTFLQVFAWVHGSLRHLPHVSTYAPMIILTGGLVLLVERRALQLREQADRHDEVSFVGFATILLGVLMGATEPSIRIISFLLAGIVWLYQAISRREALHEWIGLTFIVLAGASVGLLDDFPKPWLPALGITIALILGAGNLVAGRFQQGRLRQACIGMQVTVLMLTTVVAMLAQWRYQTEPLATGGCLLLLVGMFAWRAWRDDQLRWVHTAMAILALSLLYLGCVDMQGRTLHGNTLVFGLSVVSTLWMVLNWYTSARLVREARSTVLWVYGALAVAGMLLRVAIERDIVQGDLLWSRAVMDYCGPLMMTVVLAFTTWYSRSLIPAVMAAVIAIILFPELKANFQVTFDQLGWGSGLGSAASALGLMVLCFPLRQAAFLKDLGEGDRFMGKVLFPIRRYDHTLFTLPILASALFLTIKTDTWTLTRHLLAGSVGLKTSVALGATAVTWTLLAVFHRKKSRAAAGTYLGCLWLLAAIWFGYHDLAKSPHWTWPVLATGIVLQLLYLVYLNALRPTAAWVDDILAKPTRQVLEGSAVVLSGVCVAFLLSGEELREIGPLMVFVAAQLVWHALSTRNVLHGYLLFALGWVCLLTWTTPGTGHLLPRLTLEDNLTPTLWLLLAVHAVHLLMEFKPEIEERLRPLSMPFLTVTSVLSILLVALALIDALYQGTLLAAQLLMIVAATLLTARAQRLAALALPATLAGYVLLQHRELAEVTGTSLGNVIERLELLSEPWRLSLLALGLALAGHAGRVAFQRQRVLVAGPFGLDFARFPQVIWMFVPAVAFACHSELLHTLRSSLREDAMQLWGSYTAAAAVAIVAWSWRQQLLHGLSISLLTIGNIHVFRVFLGEMLRNHGISEIQLVCLGVAAALLELSMLRLAARRKAVTVFVNQSSLALAGLVLGLLAANYFVHPDLAAVSWLRFIISGSMAYLAGLYFRRAARWPQAGEESHVDLCEGLYHFGVTLAIWCAVLLIPSLRHPAVALCALGLPVAYFYLRAESGMRTGFDAARRYRNSASVLSFAILACYVFRAAFQMIVFRSTEDSMQMQNIYYHYNAPFIMLLSLVLLRLHGLGGTSWLAFYGGLALMVGTFFTLTWLPKLSPFEYPMASAWCAVALSHFWTLVSNQRSPLRTAIQRLAVIDGQHWFELRRSWGVCLLITTQAAVLWGILDWNSDTKMVAPLLLGAASILIHQGAIRRSPTYFAIAGVEIFLALHADFFVDSYLPKDSVIWAVLSIWIGLLVVHQLLSRRIEIAGMGIFAAIVAVVSLMHVFYHRPWTTVGLWAVAIGGVLAALTPRSTRAARSGEERAAAAVLLWIPAWLGYFSQADLVNAGLQAALRSWPLLVTTAIVFLTGTLARVFQIRWLADYDRLDRPHPRLFDQTLSWLGSRGAVINSATLWLTFAATVLAQVVHYGEPFETRELALVMGLYAAFSVGWFFEGQLRRSIPPYIVLQLCVLGFFAVARRQLMLTRPDLWTLEYDVWASLIVSFGLTGTKQVFDLQSREVRIPLLGTLCALPVIALVWVAYNQMGTNVALLVVGLHSLMFTFMGKDEKESPYNVVAIAGFIAFILLAFWSKLELRVIHAYTIPVGIGVLVLLQMFRSRIEADARNRIRLATLLVMLGSSGYYALLDDSFTIVFNMTLILVCLASMALGSFLRIRLYLALGFAALMMDVVSIVYRVLAGMERSSRMTVVGSLVLLIGVTLVFGAIYYKTHRQRINETIDRWRVKAGEWE